jgi:hypothetical protein
MSFTVVPLHNLYLPAGVRVEFGAGFLLQEIPNWLLRDPELQVLSFGDRAGIQQTEYALVCEYPAMSLMERDPGWRGQQPRSIQAAKTEAAIFANLALWLTQPSMVCFTFAFHALSWTAHDVLRDREPSIERNGGSEEQPPLRCHPNDGRNSISVEQLNRAAGLHAALLTIPRKNRIWTALRSFWAGLATFERDIRYSLFWVGLEALFGSDEPGEITYKLAQRIAFFISNSPESATATFQDVKGCYRTRSKIVHGTWEDDLTFETHMGQTEDFARQACLRLLDDQPLIQTFLQKKGRDRFLEEFVFSHAGIFRHEPTPEQEDPQLQAN